MKTHLTAVALIAVCLAAGCAVDYDWTRRIGNEHDERVWSVCTDGDANVYVVGTFEGTVNFSEDWGAAPDVKTSTPDTRNAFITKIDADGNYVWSHRMGGGYNFRVISACADGSGNLYIVGSFRGPVDFAEDWPGAGPDSKTTGGDFDVFITKIDADGGYAWTYKLGGLGDDTGTAVCVDNSGNVYLTGLCAMNSDFPYHWPSAPSDPNTPLNTDVFVTKFIDNGPDAQNAWTHRMGGTEDDAPWAICAGPDGQLFLAGKFQGQDVNLGEDWGVQVVKSAVGGGDVFVTMIDGTGDHVWTHTIGGTGQDQPWAVCLDSNGHLYVAGEFRPDVDFAADWGGTDLKPGTGTMNAFITKITDAAGAAEYGWTRRFGGTSTRPWSIESFALNGISVVYLAGEFTGTVDFSEDWNVDGTPSVPPDVKNAFSLDAYALVLGDNGSKGWVRRIGGSHEDHATALSVDPSGNLYVSGTFTAQVNFADDWGGWDEKTSTFAPGAAPYSRDAFITRIKKPELSFAK